MKSIQSYINQYCLETSRTPSVAEIANAVGISKGCAQNYLKEMDEKQMISYRDGELNTRVYNKCRTEQVGVPIAGVIPCGTPEEQVEDVEEYVFMSRALLGTGDFFILRATGDSMVDAGIDTGDLVVIRRQLDAAPGQIVAALVDGGSTLKRLDYDSNEEQYILLPENREKNYPPVKGSNISIQGVAIRVMKDL
jgi:repressor LexA